MELEKKRKADISPLKESDRHKLLRKAKKKAKKAFPRELSESSEDEENRIRTPSGTIISQKVSDIRSYFSPKSSQCNSQRRQCPQLRQRCASDPELNDLKVQQLNRDKFQSTVYRQGRQGEKRIQSGTIVNKVNMQSERDPENIKDKLSLSLSPANNGDVVIAIGNCEDAESHREDEILRTIAKSLRHATEEEIEENHQRVLSAIKEKQSVQEDCNQVVQDLDKTVIATVKTVTSMLSCS